MKCRSQFYFQLFRESHEEFVAVIKRGKVKQRFWYRFKGSIAMPTSKIFTQLFTLCAWRGSQETVIIVHGVSSGELQSPSLFMDSAEGYLF